MACAFGLHIPRRFCRVKRLYNLRSYYHSDVPIMRLESNNNIPVLIVLSRRNLQALLAKLDQPDSARTLLGGADARGVIVRAEDDDEHYADRDPGPVSPETQRRMEPK